MILERLSSERVGKLSAVSLVVLTAPILAKVLYEVNGRNRTPPSDGNAEAWTELTFPDLDSDQQVSLNSLARLNKTKDS